MSIIRRSALATIAVSTALALAACGANSDPLAGGSAGPSGEESAPAGEIIVGSANFTENEVLAELYSQALQAQGIESSTQLSIGSREVYLKALADESISVVPEYTGNLLLYYDDANPAQTAEEVEAALPEVLDDGLSVLPSSEAINQDVYVVTREYSEANDVTSLADLEKVAADAVLGGPAELEDRAYGPPGLKEIYGAEFKSFEPYDAPAVKVKDLNDDKIQVATFFTTDSAILDNDYVMLEDPERMILPQNVIPLVRSEVADNPDAVAALESVQQALTTEELTTLNKRVDGEHLNPDEVAGSWLADNGLA
ncbi:MAG: ABC transporter substrate-binding protein [Propionibacteriaceae bacterium]